MKKQRYAIALCMVMLLLSAGCVHALGEGTPMVYRSELETQNLRGKISISERWTSQSTQARAFSSLPLAGFLKADSTVPGKPAEDQGSVTIRGQKELTGRKLKDGEFTFVLKDADGNVLEETQNRGSSFAFSPIVPTSAGDAVYTVSEKNASLGGIEYDSTVYTVRIHAEENSSGEIICTSAAEPAGAIVFSNSYYAHGIAELTGVQQLMGRTREADLFSYSVKEGDATVAAGKANSDGIIEFSRIDYDLKDVGEHTYTVSLDEMELPGYTLDDTVYTVTVNVQDNADGTLQTVVTGDGSQMVFTNVYSATDSLSLEGRSVFEDEDEAKAYLGGGSLPASTFTLSEVLDGQEQVIQTVQSSREDGSIRFADLQYTQDDAGEHTYVIRQAEVDSDVLSMDESEYTVSVGVQDNGDGTLTLTKETWLDGETAEEILFTNAVNHTCLTIQNWVTGDISDYAFRFTVLLYMNGEEMTVPFDYYGSKEGRITSGDTIELKNGENVTIGNMPEGVHYRVVEEECPRYRVIVNGQDTLVSEGEALGEEGAMLEFTNSMISTTFTVYKQWVGVQGGKIRLVMYADGIEMVPQPSVTWSGNSNTYTVDGLPKYTYGGRRIIYTAKEAYMSWKASKPTAPMTDAPS